MDVIKRGVQIRSATKLGSGSGGVLIGRKLNGSLTLPTTTTGVVETPTNPILTTHVNRTTNRPLMNSMAIGRYINVNVVNPRRGYQEPFTITIPIFYHRYGHYVRPNKVAFNYHDFKKNVDPNAHVKVFNSIVKGNVKTSKEYIINAFSYMLRDKTST
jgi:hypothetical protein